MKAPLRTDYDYDPEYGSTCAIYDADGALIVEEPGPGATWQDLEALVAAYNAVPDLLEALKELVAYAADGTQLSEDWNVVKDARAAIAKAKEPA